MLVLEFPCVKVAARFAVYALAQNITKKHQAEAKGPDGVTLSSLCLVSSDAFINPEKVPKKNIGNRI